MSFLVGPVSGALVAGGVYYGFSNLIHTRTEQHRKDLHSLTVRLVETPTLVHAPPSAASRIMPQPFISYIQGQWNRELAYLFAGFQQWDRRAQEWGTRLLFGNKSSDE